MDILPQFRTEVDMVKKKVETVVVTEAQATEVHASNLLVAVREMRIDREGGRSERQVAVRPGEGLEKRARHDTEVEAMDHTFSVLRVRSMWSIRNASNMSRCEGNGRINKFTFSQFQDFNVLRQHWNTWITEGDFAEIAAARLNHIRLPIGYWAFGTAPGGPHIHGQFPYLEKAICWAADLGLKDIVDLHGVPGSQNGFDNSGQRTDNPFVSRANYIIKHITDMFQDNPDNVPIIAPSNERHASVGEQDCPLPILRSASSLINLLRRLYVCPQSSSKIFTFHTHAVPLCGPLV
ncbi:hypothetical protein PQX77_018027 [Marasmius sp. AFHP31]|nr:hypothetical protein PQX77_018027 [Marasmius sp. AFHP31]